jgi:hypothetical protein
VKNRTEGNTKSKKKVSADQKKTIVKQVTFDESEWSIIENAMESEKIDNVSVFLRRCVLLYIGKNIQQKMKL